MSTSREVAIYASVDLATAPEPWARQYNEPDDAWLFFTQYRDQHIPRNIRNVRGNTSRVSECARDYRWAARVVAYDEMREAHALHERLAAIGAAARDAGAKDAELIMRAYDLLNLEVSKLLALAGQKEFEQTTVMKPSDLIKLADLVMKMKRLSAGEATENVAVAVGVKRFGENLPDEERIKLWELARKASVT